MQVNIRQIKIKNRPDYLFNDNMIVNIKDFDSSALEVKKLPFKGVFSLNIYYIKYIPTKSTNCASIDTTDNDEDFLYLFLDDVERHIEKNNENKYLVFTPTEKNKEALKNYKKIWEETKKQIEVINDDKPIEYRKDFMKIKFESDDNLPLSKTFNVLDMIIVAASVLEKMVNIIHKFFYMNARISYKNLTVQKI